MTNSIFYETNIIGKGFLVAELIYSNMEGSFKPGNTIVIITILVLISSSTVLTTNHIQASESHNRQSITDYPPLPPRERESPIPFYEGDTILFILGVIVIAAVAWTGYIYYRYFKKVKEREKKKRQSGKKRY
ncbi:MAG: hypothetical protein ACQEQM_02060 [Thermoplasmatota archaeon]